ncbi:RecQ mediated genome instability protein [Trypanosoma melophagium]|uniref:RecQ mediated genome instability protein n=1 Tax=Trypanosoma melophagium TaxID=715481 RepID=UPI00351A819C|nr:RecQ mediated genome instability protein [Trypanosoma melophagium]
MLAICTEFKARYHIAVSARFVERVSGSVENVNVESVYQRALNENLKDITDVGTIPYGLPSQINAVLSTPLVLQVNSSRDATQPLRPCADTTEEEMTFGAALQKNTNTRLLYLVLSDGHTEIPAIELSTLRVFRGLPIPGEKLLIKEGAEVKNGAIIMTDDCVVPLGGEVQQLKREFLAIRNRSEIPYQTSTGLEAAPRFQPLRFGTAAATTVSNRRQVYENRGVYSKKNNNNSNNNNNNNNGNRGKGRGRGYHGRNGFSQRYNGPSITSCNGCQEQS